MVVPRCSSDAYSRHRLWGDHAAMIVYPTNIRYIGKSSQLREPLRYEDDLGEEGYEALYSKVEPQSRNLNRFGKTLAQARHKPGKHHRAIFNNHLDINDP